MLEKKDVNAARESTPVMMETDAKDAYALNRLTDPLTEDTSARHLVKMLDRGIWAVTYKQDVVKAKIRARGTPLTAPVSGEQLPGVAAVEPGLAFIMRAGPPGWGHSGRRARQLAVGAKAYGTPEPRLSAAAFPRRNSLGQFALVDGTLCWPKREKRLVSLELKNQHGKIGASTRSSKQRDSRETELRPCSRAFVVC